MECAVDGRTPDLTIPQAVFFYLTLGLSKIHTRVSSWNL